MIARSRWVFFSLSKPEEQIQAEQHVLEGRCPPPEKEPPVGHTEAYMRNRVPLLCTENRHLLLYTKSTLFDHLILAHSTIGRAYILSFDVYILRKSECPLFVQSSHTSDITSHFRPFQRLHCSLLAANRSWCRKKCTDAQ